MARRGSDGGCAGGGGAERFRRAPGGRPSSPAAPAGLFVISLLVLLLQLPESTSRELKYPEGVKPGDQISGSEGEYFRYKHIIVKPPDDEDRAESLRLAEDVKCKVCEVLLHSLLKRTESNSEDHIMDQLDGEMDQVPELTDNPQDNRVNMNRRGCNKHFKDELLLRGWIVGKCPTDSAAEGDGAAAEAAGRSPKQPAWCLRQTERLPSDRDVDTYNIQNEAAFHACEKTVGQYGAEIASFIAEQLEDGGDRSAAISAACREAAHCEPRRRGERRRRRRRRGGERRGGGDGDEL